MPVESDVGLIANPASMLPHPPIHQKRDHSMSFKLTDEQLMIQSMVREFSRKVVAETAAERDKTKEFPLKT
jgi:hypothetical protein